MSGPWRCPLSLSGARSQHVLISGPVLISRASPAEGAGAASQAPASARGSSVHPRGIARVELEAPCPHLCLPSGEDWAAAL